MTQRARLEESCLVMERRCAGRAGEGRRRVALQTEQIHVAQLQHVRVGPAVSQVAGLAAVDFNGSMLVHKRALLVRVALEADGILRRGSPDLLGADRPVRVVAVAALDKALIHAVVEGHFELGSLLEVAGVANLGLRLHEQKVRIFPVVRRVAGDATDVRSFVFGVAGIRLLVVTGVAGEAALVDFLGRMILENKNLGFIAAAIHVRAAWPVAILAAVLGEAAFLEGLLPMRALLPAVIKIFVARLAGFRAHERGCGFRRGGRLGRSGSFFLRLNRRCKRTERDEDHGQRTKKHPRPRAKSHRIIPQS